VGTYWVEVSNDCDVSSDTIVFNPFSGFTVDIGNDTTICADKPYIIDLNAYPNSSYQWSDGSQDDIYLVDAPGEYYVDVQNICDTVRSNIIRVTLEPCDCKFYVPNAFSPNRDGSNETFYPQSNCVILEYQFYVYNRWGQEVFRTNSNFIGWDGTYKDEPSPTGLYSYRIFYKAIRTTGEIYQESLIGNVYLLR
jgi:gliding motility-associated-like protein